MGAIASSGDPKALELFRSVMEASASIPGVFPPVMIEVEGDGKRFAEMHVDGGITTNVLVLPEALLVTNRALPMHHAAEILRDPEQQARTEFRGGQSDARCRSPSARSRLRCAPIPATRCLRPTNSSSARAGT